MLLYNYYNYLASKKNIILVKKQICLMKSYTICQLDVPSTFAKFRYRRENAGLVLYTLRQFANVHAVRSNQREKKDRG